MVFDGRPVCLFYILNATNWGQVCSLLELNVHNPHALFWC